MKKISVFLKNPIFQVVIAIFIAWFFYSLGQKEALPAYAIEKSQVFADWKEDVPELKLLWAGSEIENLYSTRVAIWNAGEMYLESSRISKSNPIKIQAPPSVSILGYRVSNKSRDDMDIKIEKIVEKDAHSLILIVGEDEALEKNDGIAVKIYYTNLRQGADFVVNGRVKGIPDGISLKEWKQEFSQATVSWAIWVGLVIFTLFSALGFYDLYKMLAKEKEFKADTLFAAFGCGFLAVAGVYSILIPNLFGMLWVS